MNVKEAISILTKVCRAYKGNAEEHDLLKLALQRVQDVINPPESEAGEVIKETT